MEITPRKVQGKSICEYSKLHEAYVTVQIFWINNIASCFKTSVYSFIYIKRFRKYKNAISCVEISGYFDVICWCYVMSCRRILYSSKSTMLNQTVSSFLKSLCTSKEIENNLKSIACLISKKYLKYLNIRTN